MKKRLSSVRCLASGYGVVTLREGEYDDISPTRSRIEPAKGAPVARRRRDGSLKIPLVFESVCRRRVSRLCDDRACCRKFTGHVLE